MPNIKEKKVYEMTSYGHNKCWMYEVYDEPPMYLATVSWGKIGSTLTSKTFDEDYCHKKEIEKMAKGYELVSSYSNKISPKKEKTKKIVAPKEEKISTSTNEHKFLDLDD